MMPDTFTREEMKPCALCGKGLLHSGIPLVWRMTFERIAVDRRAIDRQAGLELMTGSPVLAHVLGPDRYFGQRLGDPMKIMVCEPCALGQQPVVLAMAADENKEANDG